MTDEALALHDEIVKELRQRAERAEARVKELEAAIGETVTQLAVLSEMGVMQGLRDRLRAALKGGA